MGNCCLPARFRRTPSAVAPKNVTLLLLGLDNAGKTTIVKRLAGEPIDSVVPTVGFSVILLRQKGCHVSVYDLGGGPQIRDIWPRYYADAHGVVFVTDAHDLGKMEECRQVLEKLLRNDKISGKPILLLANKQDLEGALDEIDIVDHLNLEEVVNEQKCPTLVELCSALNFSKKIDIGIENGYKWLIRSIIRDYPSLNNRVLRDLAKQEDENKIEIIKKPKSQESVEGIFNHLSEHPFEPVRRIPKFQEQKTHTNGFSIHGRHRLGLTIPGQIDEVSEIKSETKIRPSRELFTPPRTPAKTAANSYSSEFFVFEKFQSDLKLLNDVPNQTLKNFLVRPKSSGARLYGVKSERKRSQRRKPFGRGNKTGPSPFTDITNGEIPKALGSDSCEMMEKIWEKPPGRVMMFGGCSSARGPEKIETKVADGPKSAPNSRRSSLAVAKRRRSSLINSKTEGTSRCGSTREILLDVTKIKN